MGNVGLGGALHAALAPAATRIIDAAAYGGKDVRAELLQTLPADADVLDLCCGVGLSTRANATGVDTSPQMVAMAQVLSAQAGRGCAFQLGNAETFGAADEYDVATVFFALHEMPAAGRRAVLHNALRVARKLVMVADIDARTYRPSAMMLTGEPYLLDYMENVEDDIAAVAEIHGRDVSTWVETGHLRVWMLRYS